MKGYKYIALLALTVLFGCEADDVPGGSPDGTGRKVPVTIRLAMEDGGLMTRGTTEDIITDESDIHSLTVHITGGNDDETLTLADFTDGVASLELYEGTKTIQAIANVGETSSSPIDALDLISEENGIPMSTTADTTWTVSSDKETYEVRLNRMVAKMKVSLVDDRATKADAIHSLSIAGLLPATTNLYRSAYNSVSLPEGVEMANWEWENPTIGETGTEFYLHETTSTEGFTVSVIENEGEEPRTAIVPLTIPRNCIQALVVHLTDYSLDIKFKTTTAPVAVLPVTREQNTYTIELPEGCMFEATITVKKNMEPNTWNTGATWSWDVENNISEVLKFDGTPSWPNGTDLTTGGDSFTFSGIVSALPVEGEECTINITMKDGANGAEMTFPVKITIRELGNEEWKTKSTTPAAPAPIIVEL